MPSADLPRVGYVVKRYPCYSETFIVREILAHERAGLEVEIFSLRPTNDGHFQDLLARVRGRVTYLFSNSEGLETEALFAGPLTAARFWRGVRAAGEVLPGVWAALEEAREEEARHVCQAVVLAAEVHHKGIGHLHASFAHEACTIARLAARIAGVSYSFTARAKDIFHE